jgi:non-lysosomal glucosylceramidase
VLRERDANGDLLPDMGGAMCTYDNFPMFGAASYVASQWLAALAYAERAAVSMGDSEAQQRYAELRAKGTKVFEEKLWNGSYYRLYNDIGGKRGDMDEGCLSDQVIGQWAAHHAGDISLLDPARVRTALKTIMRMAYQPDYGLLNCRWPGDAFLHDVDKNCWSDQANTCWTGVELAFASFLLYEHMPAEALKVIRNVDQRYRKAGMYFDHQEFGGHYFRAMSAWAIVNAALGLSIDGTRYAFGPRIGGNAVRLFFAFGGGTAHYTRKAAKAAETISVEVHTGTLVFTELRLHLAARRGKAAQVRLGAAKVAATCTFEDAGRTLVLRAAAPVSVPAGRTLAVTVR